MRLSGNTEFVPNRRRGPGHILLLAASALLLSLARAGASLGPAALAQQPESERPKGLLDVEKIQKQLQPATAGLKQKLGSSTLAAQFERVNGVLNTESPDKGQLVAALQGLQGSIDEFTKDYDSAVMNPLLDGQEVIGDLIDKVRGLLAGKKLGMPSEKLKAIQAANSKRLEQVAMAIEKEADPTRRRQFQLMFKNLLALQKLSEQRGRVDLGPARTAVLMKVISVLTALQLKFTDFTFQAERLRVVLVSQSDMINGYVEILTGLAEAEELLKFVASLQGDGDGAEDFGAGIAGMQKSLEQISGGLERLTAKLAEEVGMHSDALDISMPAPPELDGVDLDAELKKYADAGRARQTASATAGKAAR